jgi:PPP family 3-phenylpropionic acid transporter
LSALPPTPLPQARPRRLWLVWLLFFFQYAAIGAFTTYINVYLHDAGLSGTQIGVVNMAAALASVGGSMAWGYASDRSGKPRLLMAVGALGAMGAAQFTPFVHEFGAFLLITIIANLLGSAPFTLADSTALVLLGAKREDYGRYRLGGSFGYIIAGISSGFVFQQLGLRIMFPVYGAIMTGFAIVALLLPPVLVRLESSGRKEILNMVRQPAWLVFVVTIFLCWMAFSSAITFLSVSLSAMGASESLIGIASTISTFIEIPFMFFSGAFLRRFGPSRLLIAGLALMVVRFFLLGGMPAPEWAVAINVLNGPGFVFLWNSAINYANRLAPKGMAGTAQGLLVSTTNLAGVVSSLLSGWLFDRLGPTGLFEVMSFLALAALILFSFRYLVTRHETQVEATGAPE